MRVVQITMLYGVVPPWSALLPMQTQILKGAAGMEVTKRELHAHQVAGKIVRLLSCYISEPAVGPAIADLAQHLEADPDILNYDEPESD